MKGRKMWLVRCHFFCDHSISVIDFFGRWAIPLPRPFLTLVSFVKCYFRGTVFGPSPCVPLLLVELRQLLEALASPVEDVLTPARFGIRRFECEWSASRLVVLSPSSHFPLLSSVALCRWCSIGWKSIRFADFRWWSHVGDWLRGAKGQWWNLLLMMDITSECADYPAVDKQIARICRQIQFKDANSIQIIINKHVSFNHFDLYCAFFRLILAVGCSDQSGSVISGFCPTIGGCWWARFDSQCGGWESITFSRPDLGEWNMTINHEEGLTCSSTVIIS